MKTNSVLSANRKKGSLVKKILAVFAALFLILPIVFLLIVFIPSNVEIYTNIDDISDAIGSLQPRIIELENITIKTQPDSTSCGITTVTVISNYFNNTNYEANDLIEKYNTKANSHTDQIECLEMELPGRTIMFKSNVTNDEMIRDIHNSLDNNIPVHIMFAAPNPYNEPYYDFHASVVYGINLDDETIQIANSYGYSEEIPLVDFLNRMSITEIDKFPIFVRFIMKMQRTERTANSYILIN